MGPGTGRATQTQVARLLDYHRPTISQIEAGQRVVRPDEIVRFASLYGVQEAWIIHGDTGIAAHEDARVEIARLVSFPSSGRTTSTPYLRSSK